MRAVLSLILLCIVAVNGGPALAQPPREDRPDRPAMGPEQEARLQARRERLRMLREEMQRDMRTADGMPPAHLYPPMEGRHEGPRRRAGWVEEGHPPGAHRPPQPRPPHAEGPPGEGREAGQPQRMSPEERKQLRRQMREAAREVYGE